MASVIVFSTSFITFWVPLCLSLLSQCLPKHNIFHTFSISSAIAASPATKGLTFLHSLSFPTCPNRFSHFTSLPISLFLNCHVTTQPHPADSCQSKHPPGVRWRVGNHPIQRTVLPRVFKHGRLLQMGARGGFSRGGPSWVADDPKLRSSSRQQTLRDSPQRY